MCFSCLFLTGSLPLFSVHASSLPCSPLLLGVLLALRDVHHIHARIAAVCHRHPHAWHELTVEFGATLQKMEDYCRTCTTLLGQMRAHQLPSSNARSVLPCVSSTRGPLRQGEEFRFCTASASGCGHLPGLQLDCGREAIISELI
ncbi:hypothetical protein MSAN_02025300 [Mycena sanguinolenta]|uniref:Secreted protein n=1 Tax=Mycena sanguinolenta TaxID=230812 RepID=A0A8H6XJF4_9AGAR|nr:hypothetical protein MSAN_02025300 [Mycena sanguinolenta]